MSTWHCILPLRSGWAPLYLGTDEDLAAEAIDPGTVFGSGQTRSQAVSAAELKRLAELAKRSQMAAGTQGG